jgi:hypothetical protein
MIVTKAQVSMAKLGQLLVQRGWASPHDVQKALRIQATAGGRLGTCLLEMNALTEDLLLKALSEVHRVPAAGAEDLRSVPDETIASLPARVAVRWKVVPFRSFQTQVHVAMLDPRDLNCQDEVAFALGKRVQPYAAPEVRILQALDRYYGEACPSRIATLAERLDRARYLWREEEATAAVAATARPQSGGHVWEHPEAALFGDLQATPAPPRPRPRPAPPPKAEPPAAPAPASEAAPPPAPPRSAPAPSLSVALSEEERAELARTSAAAEAEAEDDGDDTRPVPADAPPLPLSFEDVEARLERVTDPEEVGRLLVGFLGHMFERVALFKVLRDRVEGWQGGGGTLDLDCLRSFRAGFDQPSVFLNLRQGGGFYLGRLGPMAVHKTLARCWGGTLPRECLLLPVRIRGRLVTVVYADREPDDLGPVDLEALVGLAASAAEAYERCILRKKKD